jgi:hypothetical protein
MIQSLECLTSDENSPFCESSLYELAGLPFKIIASTETLDGLQVSAQLELPSITMTLTETLFLLVQPHGTSVGLTVGGGTTTVVTYPWDVVIRSVVGLVGSI